MAIYLKNKDFYGRLKEFRETESRKIYEQLGRDFLAISKGLLKRSNFANYTDDRKDEMISEAVYYMCKYIHKYDLERTNAFAYFTKIAERAFLQELNNRKHRENKFISIEYIDTLDTIDNLL